MQLKLVSDVVADADEDASFASFWLLYPKKVARFKAEQVWARLSASDQREAIVALVAWRQIWIRRGEMEFVPHASTWLYQRRWEDDLPENWGGTTHASHAPAKVPTAGERSSMPENVRDVLAKLRAKKT